MNPQERQQLQQALQDIEEIKRNLFTLDGRLEFRNIVQEYSKGLSKVDNFEIDGTLNHDGNQVGLYGVSPASQANKINDPSGGSTIDSEARSAINSIIDALEGIGITSST